MAQYRPGLTYVNALPTFELPRKFNPLVDDGSGNLVFWLDADDPTTLDISGTKVLSWTEKKNGTDVYQAIDLTNCPQYGIHTMTGRGLLNPVQRNVVYFPPYAALRDAETNLDITERTVFVVCKPIELSGNLMDIFHGDAGGDMQLQINYSDASGATLYQLVSNGSGPNASLYYADRPNIKKTFLTWAVNTSDENLNYGALDTDIIALERTDRFPIEPIGQYTLSSATQGGALDIAEILIYSAMLSLTEVIRIHDYLKAKWTLTGSGYVGFVNPPS